MKILDSHWYEEYKKVGSFLPYSFLSGHKDTRDEQKKLFLEGKIHNPQLDYPFLNRDQYLLQQAKLVALREEILTHEENELVIRAYGWKITEKHNELALLLAACDQNMPDFKLYSENVYGAPKLEVFEFSLHLIRLKIEEHLSSRNAIIKNAALELDQELNQYFPDTKKEITQFMLPSQKTVSMARIQVYSELGNLIQGIGIHKKEYGAEDIEKIFKVCLTRLSIDWGVSIDLTSSSSIHVDHTAKAIKIPSTRLMSRDKLLGIILHEIGTHVLRRVNGEKSPLMLLGLGLNGYERADEGIATMREQVIEDSMEEFARAERHLAISLCYGLDGKKRDFRDVYTVVEKYLFFKSLVVGKPYDNAQEEAKDLAWITTERVFRGTTCEVPGICFTKDIMYQEGNIAIWKVVEENPAEMVRFNSGKYDPTNPEHTALLDELGIHPYGK